jgi:two-component system, NtrC family, nitrogen regulation sensor histidine kinase NtrY
MAYNNLDNLVGNFSRSFSFSLIWRLIAILGVGHAATWAIQQPNTLATVTVLVLLMCLLFADLLRLTQRTNREVERLANALQYGDFSQSFHITPSGAGFPELGAALDQLVSQLRAEMTQLRAETSHLAGLIDHVPIPLLTIDADENIELLNNAARRLFSRPHGRRLTDFAVYGDSTVDALRRRDATSVVRLSPRDDAEATMRMTQTTVTRLGSQQRLLALQPIQADLDATEMALSRNLLRVLTHEIMNSLAPVTSLAKSAANLSKTLPDSQAGNDIRTAIETVERRAEGLMQFVGRYREITGTPTIKRERFSVASLLNDIERLFRADWPDEKISLQIEIAPLDLQAFADQHLLEHVLINLLRNAVQACVAYAESPTIRLHIRVAHSGRTLIDVEDNGPGIAEAIRQDVFLPFFTTKTNGSGIGLSLARQVVLAHGGSIRVEPSSLGGACLRIVL